MLSSSIFIFMIDKKLVIIPSHFSLNIQQFYIGLPQLFLFFDCYQFDAFLIFSHDQLTMLKNVVQVLIKDSDIYFNKN